MIRSHSILLAIGLSVLLWACLSDKGKNIPDVSDIHPEFGLIRFEQELFAIDTNQVRPQLEALQAKYPAFFDLYFSYIVPLRQQTPARPAGNKEQSQEDDFYLQVADFLKSPAIRHLKDTIDVVFRDFDPIERQLLEGFQYFKYYFPEREIPNIYTLLSEYAFQVFVFEGQDQRDGIGVGLDFFLGSDYPYQRLNPRNPAFSAYLTRTFNEEHLSKKVFEALIDDIAGRPQGNRLLDIMVHNGKKLFLLDQLLPYAPDSVILEFTTVQLQWVEDNEFNIWAHLIDEELLYSTNMRDIQKLVNPSPHSTGMPPEAPGRTANWVGWQIVESFMKRHPDTSPQELLELTNAQAILDQSKYKPRR